MSVCRGILAGVFVLFACVCDAQDKAILEAKEQQLRQEISMASKLLSTNRAEQQNSISQIELLQRKLAKEKSLARNLQIQIDANHKRSKALSTEIEQVIAEVDLMTSKYQALLVSAYRQKLQSNKWLFLLASTSFNEMWRRWHYISRLKRAWGAQANVLKSHRESLTSKILALDAENASLAQLKEQSASTVARQEADKKKLDLWLAEIRQKEKGLRSALSKKEAERKRLLAAIEAIISKEMASAPEVLPNTPLGRISSDFEKSLGQLPWPVSKGIVTKYFGNKRHPALPNVTTSSNGIDIRTMEHAPVQAIFDGEIVSVTEIPGFDKVVIIRHGTFYSVYSYLETVSVSKNEKIKVGQRIGRARDQGAGGEVHLEVWKGKDLQDPLLWLINK